MASATAQHVGMGFLAVTRRPRRGEGRPVLSGTGEPTVSRTSRHRVVTRARLAAVLILLLSLGLSSSDAHAVPLDGEFSHVTVTSVAGGAIYPWDQVTVTADWALPDATPAGSMFSLSWPSDQLAGVGGDVTLRDAGGNAVATCALGISSLDCTLTPFVTTHPHGLSGTVWFTLTQVNIPESSTVTVPFAAGTTTLPVTYRTAGSAPSSFTGLSFYSDVYVQGGTTTWYVYLPGGPQGVAQDVADLVVTDTLGPSQTLQAGSFVLQHAVTLNSAGSWPVWETVSSSLYRLDASPTSYTLTAPLLKAGGWWRLEYAVTVDTGFQGQVTNTAVAAWNGQAPLTTTHSEVYVQAGGTGGP